MKGLMAPLGVMPEMRLSHAAREITLSPGDRLVVPPDGGPRSPTGGNAFPDLGRLMAALEDLGDDDGRTR
ncbi:MAG: hypothetical protein IPM75_13285 [Candidatus Competibacteraceae bacterium]|nr:hypothetical protein [Candidatus Competibacteraceae bacterium]